MLQRTRQIPHNLVFFLLATLYLWLVVEPRLIHQCFGTILPDAPFLTGWSFLESSLQQPGGFVMYVSGFCSQGYYYSWLGALVIVLSALCLCEISRRHLVAFGSSGATVLSSTPAIVLILLYSQYKHPLPTCLAVSLALGCSLVFEGLPLRSSAIRVMVYCLVAAALFWLAGAGGLLVFSVMTVMYGIFIHRNFVLSALALPMGCGIVWCLAQYAFIIPPQQAFSVLIPFAPAVIRRMGTFSAVSINILYGFVPLSAVLLLLASKVFGKIGQKRKQRPSKSRRKKTRPVPGGQAKRIAVIFKKTAAAAIPILLTGAGLRLSYDRMSKPLIQAHDYSLRRQWDAVLDLARSLPKGRSNVYFNHDVNRALYRAGRLPYDMFKFPQTPHGLLLTHEEKASSLTQLKLCDIYLELGRINTAERLATEFLTVRKHSGTILEKLAWINIIKGQYQTAQIYLNALKRDLVCRRRARILLRSMDEFTPDHATYIDTIRSRMHHAGYLGAGDESVEQILTELLASNPANRMAFEYLMACYLITGRPDKVTASMGRLKEFAYDGIPTLYEEAMLVYLGSKGQKIDLNKFNIRRETIDRYIEFVKLRNSLRPENRQIVLNRLITRFGSSYFFYSTFGRVGLM